MIPFIGVLNSWLRFARNSPLAWEALSAPWRARSSSCDCSWSSWIASRASATVARARFRMRSAMRLVRATWSAMAKQLPTLSASRGRSASYPSHASPRATALTWASRHRTTISPQRRTPAVTWSETRSQGTKKNQLAAPPVTTTNIVAISMSVRMKTLAGLNHRSGR